ncbi:Phage minor structural protein GP20 [Virgibacillus subterraneus]|uniref:Phage minor structural protein GP20 n=1 Tax=Virgibacillus subterraneus TaxID=621109 RepID=A0A1H8YY19_9BACI|nr:phage scaffolding protein [Virgibacillus subterraneus]SEP56973.1 Phage minor structural protein GP20 [Virgibacillus subterraneus]
MDLKELLGEELHQQVTEKVGDKKIAVVSDGSYIPKEKFDAVNQEKNDYKQQVGQRDEQINQLSEKAKGNEELTSKIDELKQQNETAKNEYEQKLNDQAFDHALKDSLSAAKVKNPKAVQALLDKDTIKLKDDKLVGLEEQLNNIKESDPYMFEEEENPNEPPKPNFTTGQHTKGSGDEPANLADALAQKFTK